MKTVRLEHHYDASPRRVWKLAIDFGALAEVMKGIIAFDGLPTGETETGQSFNVRVSLFGVMPWQDYYMDVLARDDEAMILQSSERGAGVKSWRHTVRVTPTEDGGSTLSDLIEIDAGLQTPVFAMWARFLYRARHKPRVRMLADGVF